LAQQNALIDRSWSIVEHDLSRILGDATMTARQRSREKRKRLQNQYQSGSVLAISTNALNAARFSQVNGHTVKSTCPVLTKATIIGLVSHARSESFRSTSADAIATRMPSLKAAVWLTRAAISVGALIEAGVRISTAMPVPSCRKPVPATEAAISDRHIARFQKQEIYASGVAGFKVVG
jgi:hypothetical protein